MSSILPVPPLVSVCIITYRHVRFIRQCVESALAQQTDFPFEIVIGEDDSDDGTREVCQELAAAHPDRIRLLLHRRADVVYVDGNPRGTHNLVASLASARGEFVALCEGDDYWTDPGKLATQVAYLKANPDCVGCFHEASLVDHSGQLIEQGFFKNRVSRVQGKYDRRECISTLMSVYPTCSLMYRRQAFLNPPQWYLKRSCDFHFDLVITAEGKLGFIDRQMAAYRRHAGGVWSGISQLAQSLEFIVRLRLLLTEPEFLANYRVELFEKLGYFEGKLTLQSNVDALEEQLEQALRKLAVGRAHAARLAADREKLLAFVNKQHAVIMGLKRPA